MAFTPPPKQLNQYTIMAELGRGGYAAVYKAFNKDNRRMYACKVFSKINLKGETEQKHFQNEVDTMAFVQHAGIVQLHDFFWDENNFYLIMDYCVGGSLFDYIVKNGRLEEPVAVVVYKQIVEAVAYCHSLGIIHRDIKPENVLIDKFPHVRITDFGLCTYNSDEKLRTFCGSTSYCAPECLSKTEYFGQSADCWSLGVLLYIMVTGASPWNVTNTSSMIQQILRADYTPPNDISNDCLDLISKLICINPDDRLSAQQILSHPWILETPTQKVKVPTIVRKFDFEIPPEETMADLVKMVKDQVPPSATNCGIASPFESPQKLSDCRSPSLPRLRAASLSTYKSKKIDSEPKKANQFRYQNESVVLRQRSMSRLLPSLS